MIESHPTWVRGLKPIVGTAIFATSVAPYVGAWIETYSPFVHSLYMYVAPYVGAWIETLQMNGKPNYKRSHPTWVRGLKQRLT